MTPQNSIRSWLVALLLCVAAIFFCIAYVDRPVADYNHLHLLQLVVTGVLNDGLIGLGVIAVLLFLCLLVAGIWRIAAGPLALWTQIPLLCAWSLMWGLATAESMKRVFGRADPEMWTGFLPGGPHLGLYGFHLFRSGPQFESFPSGTMSAAASVLAVLWILAPRFRWFWALIFLLTAVALVATNSHFVSDVIAAAFLGSSIGWMTVLLQRRA